MPPYNKDEDLGNMAETVTKAEAELIARDAAERATRDTETKIQQQFNQLPTMLSNTMYEVAHAVAKEQEKAFSNLFSKVIGADVRDDNHLRDFHKDLYWLRDRRMEYEATRANIRKEMITLVCKWAGALGLGALVAWLGFKQ